MNKFTFNTTEEINVPEKISEQSIGQDKALDIIKKAAKQRKTCFIDRRSWYW
ncbi:hypothetical protein [Candidatus Nanopusillus massiliensis]|uniref:hypothetical protein n=1 Tax=Candidatus Nanopusillus massiliensis TaxID=2897163 RepID=UPI001E29124C|nr:hypothetical protein [Candidatus Nanopusillus massiliensis]